METSCVGTGRWGKISFNSSAVDEQVAMFSLGEVSPSLHQHRPNLHKHWAQLSWLTTSSPAAESEPRRSEDGSGIPTSRLKCRQTRALNIPHKDLEPEGNMIKPRAEQTDQRRPPPRPPARDCWEVSLQRTSVRAEGAERKKRKCCFSPASVTFFPFLLAAEQVSEDSIHQFSLLHHLEPLRQALPMQAKASEPLISKMAMHQPSLMPPAD
ncbi:hypothetical protein Q8A67_018387 [Cirrhinus molitorella]|uniref:Uncharacterized protein n=1 Tax=Cirrhinus molitorella TaxID=172907 RepID=A0AA88PFZ3_9TELE|nr:hypothetical protein Q8A67_018387 [Cirrhinus molitorella]